MLEWGLAYIPKRPDIDGGVFTIRQGRDGRPRLTLIGVVLGTDSRGGSDSLVSGSMPWVVEALR